RLQTRQQLFVEDDTPRYLVTRPQIKLKQSHTLAVKTRIQILQIPEGAHKKSRADEQEERERDLRDDQNFIQWQSRLADARMTDLFFQRRGQVQTRRPQRRRKPGQQAGQQRGRQREAEHAWVQRKIDCDGAVVLR